MLPPFPRPLDGYPPGASSLWDTLAARVAAEPFDLVATGIFALAILHTFSAARFTRWSRQAQQSHEERSRALGRQPAPHVGAEVLRFLGEVEVVFGLWAVVLAGAIALRFGWPTRTEYLNTTVNASRSRPRSSRGP